MIRRPTYDDYDEYTIDYQTTNTSFIAMASLLRRKGVKNYNFFLKLYDEDLVGVNPRDPNLSAKMQVKIITECRRNYWYFIREVMIVPGTGRYELNRGNLSLAWCILNGLQTYQIMPRQTGKTWGAIGLILWAFNYATTESQFLFLNKSLGDSQNNMARLKDARSALPYYLRNDKEETSKGTLIDAHTNINSMGNALHNKIIAKASARNPIQADELGRGMTVPYVWIDEFAFLQFNKIIYAAMIPAWAKAAEVAKRNNRPSALILTTTPSDLSTDNGDFAYRMRGDSAVFTESLYDMDSDEVCTWVQKNSANGYIYIEYNYKQLGKTNAWFEGICVKMYHDWPKIRREFLLQWSNATSNSPFDEDDLKTLHGMMREPDENLSITINKYYKLNVYKKLEMDRKYIISVDPARGRGEKADRTAIIVIDAETDDCCAIFKSPTIQYRETFNFIYTLFYKYIPNSVIVVENNIDTVIEYIQNSTLRSFLYYENVNTITKDKPRKTYKDSRNNTIIYGITTNSDNRPKYFDILFEMVHSDKEPLSARELVEEIELLEYKSPTRIEAVADKHDDVVLAYLMALYIKRYGHNLPRFGLFNSKNIDTREYKKTSPKFYGAEDRNIGREIISPFFAEMQDAFERAKSEKDVLGINDNMAVPNPMDMDYGMSRDEKLNQLANMVSSKPSDYGLSHIDPSLFETANSRKFLDDDDADAFAGKSSFDDPGDWF